MANVSIKSVKNFYYLVMIKEEHLEELLIQLNQKFNELKNSLHLGENKLL